MKSHAGARRRARRARLASWACALLLLSVAPAQAVVHATGDGTGTTTPPADDPGFDHVGTTGNGLSGIYLGNRWMLTAAHVGEQSLTLGGVTYPPVSGSQVQLFHGPGVYSDVMLVRLASEPPLPPLVLASTRPDINNNVVLIGRAFQRSTTQICWNASWSEVSCNPLATYRGFKSIGPHEVRWGRNLVDVVDVDVDEGNGWITRGFQVDFDQSGVTYEAQGVPGDSGGAVFLKRGSQWELVGLMFVITVYDQQPYYQTAVFGQSTYAVDLAWYRPQIDAIVNAPEIPALPMPLLVATAAALACVGRVAIARRARSRR